MTVSLILHSLFFLFVSIFKENSEEDTCHFFFMLCAYFDSDFSINIYLKSWYAYPELFVFHFNIWINVRV